jgi:hypothetical protein
MGPLSAIVSDFDERDLLSRFFKKKNEEDGLKWEENHAKDP